MAHSALPMIKRRRQRGQAMSELIAACALLLPLLLAIIYIGKYADVKSAAIQASRYAAFERALDPAAAHKPAPVLVEEARARFFTNGARAGGKIGFQDSTAALGADEWQVPLWRTVSGKRLLDKYGDVSVAIDDKALGGKLTSVYDQAGKLYKLNKRGLYYANVEVPLVNVAHFEPLKAIDLKLGATTALLGDSWSAGSSDHVKQRLDKSPAIPASFVPAIPGIDWLFTILTDSKGPQFGCVSPDVVPKDRLEKYVPVGYCVN